MNEQPTEADLARWEAWANAATPGPWLKDEHGDAIRAPNADNCENPQHNGCSLAQIVWLNHSPGHEKRVDADGLLIAASREVVPALIAAVRELRAVLAEALDRPVDDECVFCRDLPCSANCPTRYADRLLGRTAVGQVAAD